MIPTRVIVKPIFSLALICILAVVFLPEVSHARPPTLLSRHRRVSDQRLAEIETLLGLAKMKGRVITVPIAFGVLDPGKIGRKRRSANDGGLETIERILQIVSQDPDTIAEEEDQKLLALGPDNPEILQQAEDRFI